MIENIRREQVTTLTTSLNASLICWDTRKRGIILNESVFKTKKYEARVLK